MTPRRPPLAERACDGCGSVYQPRNTLSRYCSRSCGQREWLKTKPGYQAAATKKCLAASPARQERRRAYMKAYNQRPEVIERRHQQMHARYVANPEPFRERVRERYERVARFLRSVKEAYGCLDCGRRDGILHFDHRPGTTKTRNPSQARSMRSAIAEVLKCDVRCASCHARRHEAEKRARRAAAA